MTIPAFIEKINSNPTSISFQEVIGLIDDNYDFTPTTFKNGNTLNEAGQNSGSCKLFFFTKLNNFSVDQTLQCFGDYYRKDVLDFPDKDDHQNIRNFMKYGWDGIDFEGTALRAK